MSGFEASAHVPGFWSTVWKLLRLRVIIFIRGFRRSKLRQQIGVIVLALLFLGFLGFIFFLSWALLGFLRSPQLAQYTGNITGLLESVPALVFSGTFIGILLTSFGVLLQALYLSGDMDFLLTAPVPIRAVFVTKLLQAILPNFSLICLFALPLLWGLGAAWGYNFLFYPLVVIVLAAQALAAAGISSLFVMVVVRIFPARRVAEVLGFIGAITSFICSQSGQLARFGDIPQRQTLDAINTISRLTPAWSPLTWAGRGLIDLGAGRWLSGVGLLGLTLSIAFAIFGISLGTAERLYYTGWASMQGSHQKKKVNRAGPRRAAGPFRLFLERHIPPAVRGIVAKDYRVMRRDLRNMSQLVTPLIFGLVYAVMLTRGEGIPAEIDEDMPAFMAQVFKNLPLYANVGLSLFIGGMLLVRLAGMGFSSEGKNYWLLKTAPVSAGQLILSKYLVAYFPTLGLGWLFLILMSLFQRAHLSSISFAFPVVALCMAGNAGIYLAFGIVGTNLTWDDPRHMTKGASGCLGALVSLVYLLISLALFFGPPLLVDGFGGSILLGNIIGGILGAIFCLVCAVGPLLLVRKRVETLGEE